jgi:hypothetical protein
MFGVQTGDQELFTIETVKEGAEYGGCPRRIANENRRVWSGIARHELERVTRNEQRVRHVLTIDDGDCRILRNVSRGHHGTSLLLNALALSKKPESRCRTTGGGKAVLADDA